MAVGAQEKQEEDHLQQAGQRTGLFVRQRIDDLGHSQAHLLLDHVAR